MGDKETERNFSTPKWFAFVNVNCYTSPMLGVIMIILGALLLFGGAAYATEWVNQTRDDDYRYLRFTSVVIAPILGGGILIVLGIMEFS